MLLLYEGRSINNASEVGVGRVSDSIEMFVWSF